MLVLETLPYSRLLEVGDRLLEELLQYCTEDQNTIEPAQDTVPDCSLEDLDQLSSFLNRLDNRTLSDSMLDFSEYVNFLSPYVLLASDSEFGLNIAAIEARNNIILNTKRNFIPLKPYVWTTSSYFLQ